MPSTPQDALRPVKIGDPLVVIENKTAGLRDNAYMASPSIVKLDDGRLLTVSAAPASFPSVAIPSFAHHGHRSNHNVAAC